MPCNIIKEGKKCGKDTVCYGSLYNENWGVFIETETCEECYEKIKAKERG